MLRYLIRFGLLAGLALASLGASASASPTPGDCQNDSKSLGPILLSTVDAPGTWWGITKAGFDQAYGPDLTDADYETLIERFLGPQASFEAAVEAVVNGARSFDKNVNDYVCASRIRGTRAFVGDPNFAQFFFAVTDDKHV